MAEEIVFGREEVTTGASGDLQQASPPAPLSCDRWLFIVRGGRVHFAPQVRNIARRMVAQWGYSKNKLGATSWESPEGNGGFGQSFCERWSVGYAASWFRNSLGSQRI